MLNCHIVYGPSGIGYDTILNDWCIHRESGCWFVYILYIMHKSANHHEYTRHWIDLKLYNTAALTGYGILSYQYQ